MPIQPYDNRYYDFEEIFFEKGCDVDTIIQQFFMKYDSTIKGDKEYVTYKIKKYIERDRNILNALKENGQNPLNRIGTVSYVTHDVIPEQNNGKEQYIYIALIHLFNTFEWLSLPTDFRCYYCLQKSNHCNSYLWLFVLNK